LALPALSEPGACQPRLIRRGCHFGFEEFVVRTSPSIAPNGVEKDIYLVLDDFGRLGRAWRETDEAGTNRATLIRNLLDGQYENPLRIFAFNIAEGWCRDVTVNIADELRRRYVEYDEVPKEVLEFMEANQRRC
jgi:hypothetical protein